MTYLQPYRSAFSVWVGQGLAPCRNRQGTRPCPTRARIAALLLLVLSLQLLVACDSFERNAYRTLKVTKVEYELLQEHAARAFLAGRLTQEQWDRFAIAGNRFIAAHTLAADLMKTYQEVRRAPGTPEASGLGPPALRQDPRALEARITAALAALPPLIADLAALLQSFEPASAGRQPAPRNPG